MAKATSIANVLEDNFFGPVSIFIIENSFFQYAEMWQISEKQKTMLRDDWTILRSSLESVGVVTFLNLFETHPETLRPFIQDVYTVKEIDLNEW